MSDTFFTSDNHWFHKNIIRFCDRPFDSSEEMNEAMIERWNDIVTDKDMVYHLGDFGFCQASEIRKLVKRLNGNVSLIRGNHDLKRIKTGQALSLGFHSIRDYHELPEKTYGQKVVLSHYPFQSWNKSHRGSYHLHGHCHGTMDNVVNGRTLRRLDVGVDTHTFAPWAFEEVREYMENIKLERLPERK